MESLRDLAKHPYDLEDFNVGDRFKVIPEKQGSAADGFGIFGGVHVHMTGDVDYGSVYKVKVTDVKDMYIFAEVLEKVRDGPSKSKLARIGSVDGTENVVGSKNNNLRGLR